MGSDRKQQEKRTEDFSVIRWSTCSRSIYRIFILEDKQTVEKQSPEGAPGGQNPPGRALVSCAHQGTLPGSFLFSYFSKYSKTDKNIFADFPESVYLPYHVPPYFHDSGVFQKDSFMCSSCVKVWIILLSTLMGIPEI